jgi:hypothetical protein
VALKPLDALGLAVLEEKHQIPCLAAIWCRAFRDRAPTSKLEIVRWAKHEFGPIFDAKQRDRIAIRLMEETKRQLRIRRKRRVNYPEDVLLTPMGSDARVGGLLNSRLGPAETWVRRQTLATSIRTDCYYIDAGFYSGLVAGLVPVQMSLRRIVNPCLLVYRKGKGTPQSYWVPGHITTVADAFIWVIPPAARDFLELEGTRVEHDGESQSIRLHTQFGSKILPWRAL